MERVSPDLVVLKITSFPKSIALERGVWYRHFRTAHILDFVCKYLGKQQRTTIHVFNATP
jgi:hypothetical protein